MGYKINGTACAKMVLHAARYPSNSVNGVLLGRETDGGVEVTDALPLLHSNLSLLAMLELGLAMSATYAQQHNLTLLGYYEAPAALGVTSLTPTMTQVGNRLWAKNQKSIVVMLEGKHFAPPFDETFKVYGKKGGSWDLTRDAAFDCTQARPLLDQNAQRRLVDFDDHLDDGNLSWPTAELM